MALAPDRLGDIVKRFCAHCGEGFYDEAGWATPKRRGGPYCTRGCASLARMATRPPAVFTRGLLRGTPRCLRAGCGGLLAEEGPFLVCHYGCGDRWPIRGAAIADAVEYERHAGIPGAA